MFDFFKKWWGMVLVFILIFISDFFLPRAFLMEVMIFSIYAMGANYFQGYIGEVSFGQPVYLAFGAYGAAFYLVYFGVNPVIGILSGVLLGLIISILVGRLFMKLTSSYFTLVNLAFLVIGYFTFQRALVRISGGDDGLWFLGRISSTPFIDISTRDGFFIFTFIVLVFIWILMKYILEESIFGRLSLAINDNAEKLEFLGYNVINYRWFGFVLANTLTAFAGSLYALHFGFVSPSITDAGKAIEPVVVVLLGGTGSLFGPIVGSYVYIGLKDMAGAVVQHWEFLVGLLVIIIMIQGDKGIMGNIQFFTNKIIKHRKSA